MIYDKYFDKIDAPIKGYILGLILYNIKSIHKIENKIVIEIVLSDELHYNSKNIEKHIQILQEEFDKLGTCEYDVNDHSLILTISSCDILDDIKRIMNTNSISSTCDLDLAYFFKNNTDIEIQKAFIKSYVEKYGNIISENNKDKLHITFYLKNNIEYINKFNIPFDNVKLFNLNIAIFHDVNMIDYIGILYNNENIPIINYMLYDNYYKVLNGTNDDTPNIEVYRTDKTAILPFKNRESDAGYDITVIKECKKLNDKTTLYDTGIKMKIPNGYYVEIVPRSSLSKSGYMLANSIGIIDQSYRGNIFVALCKIDEKSNNIELPFKCCQMIIRKQIYGKIIESFNEFDKTDRDSGCFGSTT